MSLSRRDFLLSSLAIGFATQARANEPFPVDMKAPKKLEYKYQIRETEYDASVPPGTIVIDGAKPWPCHTLWRGDWQGVEGVVG
jgi:hypothetical protein